MLDVFLPCSMVFGSSTVMLTEGKKVINTLGWENRCAICPGYMFSENREEVYIYKKERGKSWAGLPQKPPCPFSRASYGEPGLRSPGHWCLLPSTPPSQPRRLCRNLDGPLTTPYSHKSFTPGTEGDNFAHRVKNKQANGKEKHSVTHVDKTNMKQTHNQRKAWVIRGYSNRVYLPF